MNKYFYIAIMVFSHLASNLFGMRSAIPFKGTNPSRSTKTMPASASERGTTVNIPVESSNQALAKVVQEQQEEQNRSNNSKWYKDTWKYLSGLGAGAATGIALEDTKAYLEIEDQRAIMQKLRSQRLKKAEFARLEKEFEQFGTKFKDLFTPETYKRIVSNLPQSINALKFLIHHGKERIATSHDAKIKDPTLYNVFLKIKNDLGITENIQLRIASSNNSGLSGNLAAYSHPYKTIMINQNYNQISQNELIFALAHELGHVQQYFDYPESYHIQTPEEVAESKKKGTESKTNIHRKAETSADANAAGYFDCPECLKDRQKNIGSHSLVQYDSSENASKDFTIGGYFSPQDYDPYIERACLEGEPCKAHKMLGKPKEIDLSVYAKDNSFYQAKKTQNQLNFQYNRSLKQRENNLPIEFFLPRSAKTLN